MDATEITPRYGAGDCPIVLLRQAQVSAEPIEGLLDEIVPGRALGAFIVVGTLDYFQAPTR